MTSREVHREGRDVVGLLLGCFLELEAALHDVPLSCSLIYWLHGLWHHLPTNTHTQNTCKGNNGSICAMYQ